jgi:hypothetical protein
LIRLPARCRYAAIAAILALSILLHPMSAQAGNFLVLFGARQLDDDTWSPVDTQTILGFELDAAPKRWPVRLTTGLHLSEQEHRDSNENIEEAMTVLELSLGVRKIWLPGKRIRPYVGGGASLILNAHFEIDPITLQTETNDSGSLGAYAAGGVLWRTGSRDARFNLGLDVRILRGAEASFTQRQGALDYEQLTLTFGFNWGKDRDKRP